MQSYLGDLWARTAEARSAGLTPSEAAEQIDMSDHADDYPSITGPGVPLTAIARMYELMGG